MKSTKKVSVKNKDFELKTNSFLPPIGYRHVYNKKVICVTDSKGYPHPDNKDLTEIRVDSSNGIIPLWDKGVTLNWRFKKTFSLHFKSPEAAKENIRKLIGEAIVAWKDACPIKFHEDNDAWDFEIAMHDSDCDNSGCVLASSFFPDQGQHTFYIYPSLLQQSQQEQIETIEHELGHIFGLRHFFAKIKEAQWGSELFGTENPFSIMNYGDKSKLNNNDIKDLKLLYQLIWTGKLTEINGTKIKRFVSFHMTI